MPIYIKSYEQFLRESDNKEFDNTLLLIKNVCTTVDGANSPEVSKICKTLETEFINVSNLKKQLTNLKPESVEIENDTISKITETLNFLSKLEQPKFVELKDKIIHVIQSLLELIQILKDCYAQATKEGNEGIFSSILNFFKEIKNKFKKVTQKFNSSFEELKRYGEAPVR